MNRIHPVIWVLFSLSIMMYATAEIILGSVRAVQTEFVEHRCEDPGQGI